MVRRIEQKESRPVPRWLGRGLDLVSPLAVDEGSVKEPVTPTR